MQECEDKTKQVKIEPYLIMDDIAEKLKLVNYEILYCRQFGKKPFSRIYFSHEDGDKFEHFYDLAYWLMSLLQGPKKKVVKI